MIDPATLLSVGGSLLGGLLGRSKPKYVVPPYAKIRAEAEAAGFNPLTALGMAPGSVVMAENPMGSAIADSALMLAESVDRRQQLVQSVQSENTNLRKQVQRMTLRPDVGGIYARRQSVSSIPRSMGASDVSSVGINGRLADPVALVAGSAGGIAVPDPRLDRASGIYVGSERIEAAPGWSSSQVVEDNYGDVAQSVYGLGKLAADLRHTNSLRPGMTYGRAISSRDWNLQSTPDTAPSDRATRLLRGRMAMQGVPLPQFNWGY